MKKIKEKIITTTFYQKKNKLINFLILSIIFYIIFSSIIFYDTLSFWKITTCLCLSLYYYAKIENQFLKKYLKESIKISDSLFEASKMLLKTIKIPKTKNDENKRS